MSGAELVEALKLTGTGPVYLAPAVARLGENAAATDREVEEALRNAFGEQPFPAGKDKSFFMLTAAKARRLIQGADPLSAEFHGTPPASHQDGRLKTFARELVQQMAEKVEEKKNDGSALGEVKRPKPRERGAEVVQAP
jgi:hypothetical protein